MNLGDGLKLETELLDGKTKLILSPYECKSKISVKMGNKTKTGKCPSRTKQAGYILKSTQNACIRNEKLLQKKKIGSETSLVKGEKNSMAFSLTKDLCKEYADKDCLHIQKEIPPATSDIQKTRNTINTSVVAKQKPYKKHIVGENMKSSFVCLTQDQLQKILMTVNQGNRSILLTENGKEEETSQYSLHLNSIPNQPKDENIMGLLQKTEAVSQVQDENKSVLNKNQETSKQPEQKILIENVWKPADIFSTLGERERDRNLLEAKKAQWRKELDEQVALKKKEREAPEKWNNPWKKSESDKIVWEKLQILDQSKTFPSVPGILSQSPSQVAVVQADGHSSRAGQILEGEEHDRWAIHFDSLKSYPGSQSQLSSQSSHKQPEYFCVSPDTQELADISSVYTPTAGSQIELSEEEHIAKPVRGVGMAHSQKTNFLRSMTALLDPAQIEERDRRRQKQLEHQKAITAQVEEKRRKKQLQEEQRKKEEQEEELRLAREREEMQKQYEEDILKQKQKEEIITLKTNELFQTMQRAQELAQRLKQEQRIRELAQKGHDTSRLIKNLGVNSVQVEFNESTNNISNSRHSLDEISGKMNTCVSFMNSSKKDTGVQTGTSPVHSSHQEAESKFRWHLVKKEEERLKINSFSKERSQSPPVSMMKNRTQQTQTLKNNYERENLISGGNQTELSPRISEPSHFIPYVRTNEIYYLDPDAPLSRPLTQDLQYPNPQNCDQEQRQLFDSDYVRDPLLNPNLVKNRDRQQAILKGLSELRQGLLQKQRELETNLMPLAANQEEF
ncbi:coiled-coil domain-containing protein 66 isoform X7 [Sturnira hondurensis]|uniref:coiled-coil domain-containing protein 66 isoform X7 n=1 Tax=Sturnira hondurensis TaxID=192404 RepID=UPI00187900FA|nr:coiled-coil domain-containing protein 66 isoform X7 [Sturnira hondurensis]